MLLSGWICSDQLKAVGFSVSGLEDRICWAAGRDRECDNAVAILLSF